MRIIQIELPNNVEDDAMHDLFDKVSEVVWSEFDSPTSGVAVRVGSVFTSL